MRESGNINDDIMKIYDGAMMHMTNKQKTPIGELGEVISLDLGDIPEDIIKTKIAPIVNLLSEALSEYKIYSWISTGWHDYHEENTVE